MQRNIRNLLIAQIIIMLLVSLAFLVSRGLEFMLAAMFGGSILIVNTVLMIIRFRKAQTAEGQDFAVAMYAGAAQRFFVTIAGFAIGVGWLQLQPVPQLVAFALGYIGFIVAARNSVPRRQNAGSA